ncbi:MAG: hypothetical protein JSV18_01045 [Candidatus Bathyarchaeota archaeon]|nr:MAG: hypothetical protein JSV18_01045 [Candidatus Bathyarchaeota archaeon]
MTEEFEERFIKPIIHASYPGTLAALNLTVLQVTGPDASPIIRMLVALGSMMFLVSSFSIFFYTIYPTKRNLWTTTAISFLLGLTCSLIAVIVILAL